MSRIRVKIIGEGQHPSERVIAVQTAGGVREDLIVDSHSLESDTIDVGYPVGSDGDKLLIELPRETVTGKWRVWMHRADVLEGIPA